MKSASKFSFGIFLLNLISTIAFPATPREIYQENKDSVFEVLVLMNDRKSGSQGSAVALAPETLATNCHVLNGGISITVGTNGKMLPGYFVIGDQQKDICIISVPQLNAKPVIIGKTSDLQIGDPVCAIGAPKGLERSLSKGIISQLRGSSPKLIQHDAAITHGSSGGGLFDENGKLIGITNSGIEGANINFALPVEYVSSVAHIDVSKAPIASMERTDQKTAMPVHHGKTDVEWAAEASRLEDKEAWEELKVLSQSWILENPKSEVGISFLAEARQGLKDYQGLIATSKHFIEINPNIRDGCSI